MRWNKDKTYKPNTIVRIIKTGEFAKIKDAVTTLDGSQLLHYHGYIEGRGENALWALNHHDIELECLPDDDKLTS